MIKRSLFLLLVLAAPIAAQQNPDFHREFPPFKIAGNLYWVGTADLSVYLINTPQGNILINSDFPEDLPLVKPTRRSFSPVTRITIMMQPSASLKKRPGRG